VSGREYCVYILSSRTRAVYVGFTNDLPRRLQQHRDGKASGFTRRYRITRLVYVETTPDVQAGIAREKQIKGWTRAKKVELIASMNPLWRDLGREILPGRDPSPSLALRSGRQWGSAQRDRLALCGRPGAPGRW
jgi:putative endonuclease